MNVSFKNHFALMAIYNTRMNFQVYETSSKLTNDQLKEDRSAFFGSIFSTLNHIMVGDLLWLTRYRNHSSDFKKLELIEQFPAFPGLSTLIYQNFDELYQNRKKLDRIILDWIKDEITKEDFEYSIEYTDTKGFLYKRNFAELLFHFFNHQTHHRGQISTLLSQFGQDIGVTDFLIDIPTE